MKMEPLSTPRRSSKRNSSSFSTRSCSGGGHNNNKESKNPYAMSGLDKFSALLAELEEKKQKIYSQVNPEEISLVRFVYKDSDHCVPIVVKAKKKEKQDQQSPPRNQDSDDQIMKDKFPLQSSSNNSSALENNKQSWSWSWSWSFAWSDFMKMSNNWRQPCYYLPAVIVLILLFLVFFGRSFAILCTSIGWYLVPTLQQSSKAPPEESIKRPAVKKRQYMRLHSDNKIVPAATASKPAATKFHSGNIKKLTHQKSW